MTGAERWRPDGWGATTRIGVLTPHADLGPEAELNAMAPPGVTIHASRAAFGAMAAGGGMDPTIPLAPVRAFAEGPELDDAAELLAAAPIDAIGYGFTSSAYVLGAGGEAAMIARLERRTRGIPVVAACTAALAALRLLGARRVALIDPPWFDAELSGLGRPVLSANQVLLWAALGAAGADPSAVTGYGRVFTLPAAPTS